MSRIEVKDALSIHPNDDLINILDIVQVVNLILDN